MPATRTKRKAKQPTKHEVKRVADKLPPEILAAIFVICAQFCSTPEDEALGNYPVQLAITAVCRKWRSIALETPQLWTRVTLSDPAPWTSSALYLARSGSISLLDIDIDMREEFWEGTENGTTEELTERAKDALAFIVSHGGTTSRWRSATIITDTFGPHRVVIDFLGSHPFAELKQLQLMFEGPSDYDDEDEAELLEAAEMDPLPLFQHPPPKLNMVKLAGVPNPFLFGHTNQLALPTLTHLELTPTVVCPSLDGLAATLRAANQLEVLRLNFSEVEYEDELEDLRQQQNMPKINLSRLRELGLLEVPDPLWLVSLVMVLEAPNLEYLQLNLVDCGEPGREDDVVGYLATGGDRAAPQPVFPLITHLGVQLREPPRTTTKLLKSLLLAHPQVTRLDVSSMSLDAINASPRMLPNLEHLRVADCSGSDLKRIVAARIRAKAPLKVVELDKYSKDMINPEELKFILSKVELRYYDPMNENRIVGGDDTDGDEDPDEEMDEDELEDLLRMSK